MKVSIITATYNSEAVILRCINSIRSQTFPGIEHIIIDGNSSDSTLRLINEHCTDVTLISEPDQGIYDALNKGISLATGDIVGFLHSDDIFASDHVVMEIVEAIQQTGCMGVYGDLEYIREDAAVLRYWKAGHAYPGIHLKGWMPPHPTLFLKKEVYDNIGLFDISYRIAADYEFILRLLPNYCADLQYLPASLVKMRTGGVSNRGIKNLIRKSSEDLRALKKHRIPHPFFVLFLKNISKLSQFFLHH